MEHKLALLVSDPLWYDERQTHKENQQAVRTHTEDLKKHSVCLRPLAVGVFCLVLFCGRKRALTRL